MNPILSQVATSAVRRASSMRAIMAASALACLFCLPAAARDLPEFSTRVWMENNTEVATVAVNGKDVITLRSRSGFASAADEAEDLACRLQELVVDKDFDPVQLLPGREGDKSAVRLAGGVVASFCPMSGKAAEDAASCMKASLKLVNSVRVAMGAKALPVTFPDLSDPVAVAHAGRSFSGKASWYGPHFNGRKTSDGHRFNMDGLTAAHRSLPFGTKLLVMNRRTGDSCVVEVNDRGPFIANRVLDLSRGAARRLNMLGSGVAMVDCLVLGSGNED